MDSTDEPGGLFYGQGDHFIHTVAIDGDGREAVVLGAAVIDSNGDGRVFRYPNETLSDYVEGRQAAWVDLLGDWREEIITSVPGELRIYLTPIPAEDRRVTLMQDPLYRNGVTHLSMGYGQPPLTGYYIGRTTPAGR